MKLLKELPDFKSEDEEFEFWATHDSSEYMDWANAQRIVFPNLPGVPGEITVKLEERTAQELRQQASERAVDLHTLAAEYIREGIRRSHGLRP